MAVLNEPKINLRKLDLPMKLCLIQPRKAIMIYMATKPKKIITPILMKVGGRIPKLTIILTKATNTKVIILLSIMINEKKKMMIGEINFEKTRKNKVKNGRNNEAQQVTS
jgi:hypothetical protein